MKYTSFLYALLAVSTCLHLQAETHVIKFNEIDFLHRWSKNTQHEFTPEGQEDLKAWVDMLTVNLYPDAETGEELASLANNLLGLYQQFGGMIVHTASKPRTEKEEAEHYVVVILPDKTYLEVAFVRLGIFKREAYSIVVSRRIYGEKAGDETSAWLKKNGEIYQRALLKLDVQKAIKTTEQVKQDSESTSE